MRKSILITGGSSGIGAACARAAVEAGAVIVMPLTDEDYGDKNYSCRDPEGYLWNFGSYDPWEAT